MYTLIITAVILTGLAILKISAAIKSSKAKKNILEKKPSGKIKAKKSTAKKK